MESMKGYRSRVEGLRCRARAQVDVLLPLNKVFAEEAEHLRRHDQAQQIDALGEKIAQEVRDIRWMEAAASYGFTKGTLITGLATFGIGSLLAAARHSREHPLAAGARLAGDQFAPTAPFGEVRVAVGTGGIPDDVKVIPLSQLAREQGENESEVVAALEASSYRLLRAEDFFTILNELTQKVLKGTLALPVAPSRLGRHREGLSRTT